jgi:hypothetical protein
VRCERPPWANRCLSLELSEKRPIEASGEQEIFPTEAPDQPLLAAAGRQRFTAGYATTVPAANLYSPSAVFKVSIRLIIKPRFM